MDNVVDEFEADRQEIHELHRLDCNAALSQDFAVLRLLLDDGAVVIAPGTLPLYGKANLDVSFVAKPQQEPSNRITDYRFEWSDLQIFGQIAVEWGLVVGEMEEISAGTRKRQRYNVLRVLIKRPELGWRIFRTIWNEAPLAPD